ncbi:MAG: hypothetical protein ABI171_01035 [Collimonas sp.]|uniref:hypothetical protein n=1 Tax=Collimonas sp. TaxID=1963772 RepID=UPI0032647BE2
MFSKKLTIPSIGRHLVLTIRMSNETVSASVHDQKSTYHVAYATADCESCRIDLGTHDPMLWIGSAAFDITQEDSEKIAAEFGFRITAGGMAA